MSENKTLHKILDDVIDEAAFIAAENLGSSIHEAEITEFSKAHEETMRRIFRKERNKVLFKKASRYSKRIALLFLVLVVLSGVTMLSVEAWRIKVMNFIIERSQTHSEIHFSEDDPGDSYTSDEITLGYIPEGFTLEKSDVSESSVNLIFKQGEHYFIFSMNMIDSKINIDTENASLKKYVISGQEALYSSNNNVNILVWHDEEFSYKLSGKITEDDIVKIAENIKK